MPGTAFGFPSYATQRPSVSPQQVGQMLVQRQQPPQPPAMAPRDATRVAGRPGAPISSGHAVYPSESQTDMRGSDIGARVGLPQLTSSDPTAAGRMLSRQMSGDVGRLLSDSGMDDTPIGGSPHLPSAVNIAAQNATARGPAVMQGSQPNAPSPLSEIQLRRMGVSDAEIQLLRLGGGIR